MAVATEAQFHVLAVDDSLVDRKLIERLLKSSSFQVTTVDSGSKALELLGLQQQQQDQQQLPNSPSVSPYQQEIEVSLVITDYCMPGMTGYDLLKKIKESSSLKDIPVVIMSSENVPSRINRCLEEGADEFLLKPVKLSDVKKLRPHIMKGKSKEQQQEPHQQQQLSQPNQHQQQLVEPSSEPETQESQKEQCMQLQQSIHHLQPQEQQTKEQKQVQPPQQHLQQGNQNGSVTRTTTTTTATTPTTTSKPASGTKRKAVDSEASITSPDERPRPNYKVKGYGLTVV